MEEQKKYNEYLEGLLVKAIQSGKQETSGLVGELKRDMSVIQEILKEQNKALLRIEDQTTKHNGRMRSLEMWRSYIIGGLSVLSIVMVLLGYIWNTKVSALEYRGAENLKLINEIQSQKN